MKVEIPDYLLAQLVETEDAIAEFIKAPAANYPIEELRGIRNSWLISGYSSPDSSSRITVEIGTS